jgi:cyclohexanone monooxygenase
VTSIEQHVDWIADCLAWMDAGGRRSIDVDADAQRAWGEHVSEVAAGTLFPRADSWYVGANIPGKPRVLLPYLGGLPRYMEECAKVAGADYRGFTKVAATSAAGAP